MWSWLRRLAYALTQARHDAELREEIEAHRALRAAHLERQGLAPQQAAEASRRAIGNVLLAREEVREVWLGSWATWWQDVRYGVRTFRKSPTFTAVAISTLALGIGVNAGIFTVLNGVLFRDLPAADAHELVSIRQAVTGGAAASTTGSGTFTTAEYASYRDRSKTLSGMLAHSGARETTLAGDTPQEVFGTFVSCNYFTVLQDPPPLGRGLAPRDCERGADPVVVIGHRLWSTVFDADHGIIGRTVELDRRTLTVVGVAGERTYGGALMKTDFFAPLIAEPLLAPESSRYGNPSYRWLHLIGRRGGGVAPAQVRAEFDVIASHIDRQDPGRTTVLTVSRATPMNIPAPVRGAAAGAAAVLMAAFGLVLLIACANVANMLLARGSVRSQEIGIRLSLGASRGRVVRQLMTESMLVAIAGGLLGSILALWSFQALVALALPAALHPEIPAFAWAVDVSPDLRVLWFALALTLGTGLLFGAAPALHLSRPDLHGVVKQDGAGAGSGRRGARLRGTLVGVQVALSMVLMMATGLLLRGLHAAYTTSPGFDYEDVAYVSFGTDYGPPELLDQRLMDRVAALPGVDVVAYASQTPLGESSIGGMVSLPGQGERRAEFDDVTPGYFALLGLRMVRGRTFTAAEAASAGVYARTLPVVVSDATARSFWGDADPIGRTLRRGDVELRVVGVVADAQLAALGTVDRAYIYQPRQAGGVLLVRSRTGFAALPSAIRAIVRERDPAVAFRVLPLAANVAWWRGLSGSVTGLGAGLGVLALVLASVGIYGVVSFAVSSRAREIGIRIALGARAGDVLGAILRQAMRPVAIGAAAGLAAAIGVSRILSGVLFGVSPADPLGLGGAALFVAGIALMAGLLAARPAAYADPSVTLRAE